MTIIIAVDGQAAAGKGTLSRALASRLNLAFLDTGALYRAVARHVMDYSIDHNDGPACTAVANKLKAAWAERADIRGEVVGRVASKIAVIPGVRSALLDFQRKFAAEHPGADGGSVLDGRDIGTVICPMADFKFYLIADPVARARRRLAEDPSAGTLAEIMASIIERDTREAERATAPMRPAVDAVIIDTSELSVNDVFETAMGSIGAKISGYAQDAMSSLRV